jgi:hypothetical protein
VPENPCKIDNTLSSMEEYGDLDEETGEFTYKEEHSNLSR